MVALLLLFTMSLFAATDSTDAFEKTYPRDNTFCSYKNQRIELLIRGSNKFIESKDRGYGEFIFVRRAGKKPKLLELNNLRGDTFRFFLGTSPHCSKSHGYQMDPTTMAVLFLKENKPFTDKLVIQLFDLITLTPKNNIETNYPVDRALKITDGFVFRTVPEMFNPDMGKVKINGEEYIYQEKSFPLWINYTTAGFETSLEKTFSKSPWPKTFKDIDDFIAMTGWNASEKKFSKTVVYQAVNHKIKKTCLLIIEAKQKLAGTETWRCQAI
jgi:hypothetical protein